MLTNNYTSYTKHIWKFVLVGDSTVGKTSMILRFMGKFDNKEEKIQSTIGIDFVTKTVQKDGMEYEMHFWDTAGQERFHALTSFYIRGSDFQILVYDVNNQETFLNIYPWIEEIKKHVSEPKMTLVGNKLDLERNVSMEQGFQMADQFDMNFIETSVLKNKHIHILMDHLIKQIQYENYAIVDSHHHLVHQINFNNENKKQYQKTCYYCL